MEHRVKQRSLEWFKLRKQVALTASQFADAVGVGRGKPFHFFQSLVERDEKNDDNVNDDDSNDNSQVKEMLEHGAQMEAVIKEAYELLTGLRVIESGFWMPAEGHSMEGLIGASPDGIVVSEKDPSAMQGLVEFKAPMHKLYDKIAGMCHGIPRRYMVQMQGQMAVCGAPWCDFMAVCSSTRDLMLRRVYFQPRFWEHVASRLKQFCFALQEADIMGELGRDVYSGAMTKRISSLPLQERPLPAEDVITVENLLSPSPPHHYRGPSLKLLSYQVLVGDAYTLPPVLSVYQKELLAKVDAEIQQKISPLSSPAIRDGESGKVLRRVFSHEGGSDASDPPPSPETVFREGTALWDKENVSLSLHTGATTTTPVGTNMKASEANLSEIASKGTSSSDGISIRRPAQSSCVSQMDTTEPVTQKTSGGKPMGLASSAQQLNRGAVGKNSSGQISTIANPQNRGQISTSAEQNRGQVSTSAVQNRGQVSTSAQQNRRQTSTNAQQQNKGQISTSAQQNRGQTSTSAQQQNKGQISTSAQQKRGQISTNAQQQNKGQTSTIAQQNRGPAGKNISGAAVPGHSSHSTNLSGDTSSKTSSTPQQKGPAAGGEKPTGPQLRSSNSQPAKEQTSASAPASSAGGQSGSRSGQSQAAKAEASGPQSRKLSRIRPVPRSHGQAKSAAIAGEQKAVVVGTPQSGPNVAPVSRSATPRIQSPRMPSPRMASPRMASPRMPSPRMGQAPKSLRAAGSSQVSPQGGAPRLGPRRHVARNMTAKTAAAAVSSSTSSGSSPRAGIATRVRMAAPRTESFTSPKTSTTLTSVSTISATSSSTSSTSLSSVVPPAMVKRSARDEWEMAAKSAGVNKDKPAESAAPQPSAHGDSVTSQGKPEDSSASLENKRKEDTAKSSPQSAGDESRSIKVLTSGSTFVPPGLTLLSSGSSSQSTFGPGSTQPSVGQAAASDQQRREQPQSLMGLRPDAAHQPPNKRSSNTFNPDFEAKKPLMEQPDERGESQHQAQERLSIHRPWQSMDGRREAGPGFDRERHAVDTAHQRPHEELSRIPSVLETRRDDPPSSSSSSSFIFERQDRMISDNLQMIRTRGQQSTGQKMSLLGNPTMPGSMQFENLRNLPLDLSERRHMQERELFVVNRGGALLSREPAGLGLDHGGGGLGMDRLMDRGGLGMDQGGLDWRGQPFQRQMPGQLQQSHVWGGVGGNRPEQVGGGMWARGIPQGGEGVHGLDMQRDRRFPPGIEGRDPHVSGPPNPMEFRGDIQRGQYPPRNFPPRRPYDF